MEGGTDREEGIGYSRTSMSQVRVVECGGKECDTTRLRSGVRAGEQDATCSCQEFLTTVRSPPQTPWAVKSS